MKDEQTSGVPHQPVVLDQSSAEEHRQMIERLEAEYPPVPAEELERYWDDVQWVRENLDLHERYPGKWLAVHTRRILAVGDDHHTVLAEAEKVSGLPRNTIAVTVIPTDEDIFWDPHAFAPPFPD
jgi:Family of unknown function (DUF5678)